MDLNNVMSALGGIIGFKKGSPPPLKKRKIISLPCSQSRLSIFIVEWSREESAKMYVSSIPTQAS